MTKQSDASIWEALNRIKGGALVYFPLKDKYWAVVSLTWIRTGMVAGLLSRRYIDVADRYSGRYALTGAGKLAWLLPPFGNDPYGRCDGCGTVASLKPAKEYRFLCNGCNV